jgi:hypothetical protein
MIILLLFPWIWNMSTGGICLWAMTNRDVERGRTVVHTRPHNKNLRRGSGTAITSSEKLPCEMNGNNSSGAARLLLFHGQINWKLITLCKISGFHGLVGLVRIEVSEEGTDSIIRVTRIGKPGATLAVTNDRSTLRRNATLYYYFIPECFGCYLLLTLLLPRWVCQPDDGGDTSFRNVGSYKSHTASHPRTQHSSWNYIVSLVVQSHCSYRPKKRSDIVPCITSIRPVAIPAAYVDARYSKKWDVAYLADLRGKHESSKFHATAGLWRIANVKRRQFSVLWHS